MKNVVTLILFLISLNSNASIWTVNNSLDSGQGSLRAAIDSSSTLGDTITFNPNLILFGSDSIILDSSLILNKPINIIGLYNISDTLFVSGGTSNRVFTINTTGNVKLDSLIFVDGYVNGSGGAISCSSADTLFISNSVFKNNEATIDGGSIFTQNTTLEIYNSKFNLNNAINNGGSICCFSSDTLKLVNSIISNNYAGNDGGGIFSNFIAKAVNCIISNNNAGNYGGGFCIDPFNSPPSLLLDNSTLISNIASSSGGGAFLSSHSYTCTLNAYNSLIKYNVSTNGSGGGIAMGSYYGSSIALLYNSIIENNISETSGGGLSSSSGQPFNLRAIDCNIQYNTTNQGSGGGLNLSSAYATSNDTLEIKNSILSHNNASGGGAIYCNGNSNTVFDIQNSHLDSNHTSIGHGGAINVNSGGSNLNILNSSLNYNSSNGSSGAIHLRGYNKTIIDSSEIQYNTSTTGGGLYFSTFSLDLDINNSIISNNNAIGGTSTVHGHGGGIYLGVSNSSSTPSNIKLNNTQIQNNNAIGKGGGFFYGGSSAANITIYESTISNNNSGNTGGGIYVLSDHYSQPSYLTIEKSTINENIGNNNGGGIYARAFDSIFVLINKSTITKNRSNLHGGGIYSYAYISAEVNISNSTITNNSALGSGDGIFSTATTYSTSISKIKTSGSIIAHNSNNNIYNSNSTKFISYGFNIFSDSTSANTIPSDHIGIDSATLNLDTLNFNGGKTKVLLPLYPSTALNSGNPTDTNEAQNSSITDIREIGSAESCVNTPKDVRSECVSFTWINGITYFSDNNTATKTLTNSFGCDSIITLNLSIHNIDTTISVQNDILTCHQNQATYQWINCNSNSPIPGETNRTFTPTSTGSYAVEIIYNGCVDTSLCRNVYVCNSNPYYTYSDDGNGSFSFYESSNGDYTNVHWAFGDGNTSTLTNPTHAFASNNNYTVVLSIYDSNIIDTPCIKYYVDTINISSIINPLQCNAGWVVLSDSNTGLVTIINNSTGVNLNYHWDFGDGDTSNTAFPSHVYNSNGPYYLCLTINDNNGCIDTYCDSINLSGVVFKKGFDIKVVPNFPTSIRESSLLSEIQIYPNPTSNFINIRSESLQIRKIEILSSTGIIINSFHPEQDIVNLSHLPNGAYFFRFFTSKRIFTKKIIKL